MMAKRWLSDNKSRKVYTLTVDSGAERRAKSCIVDAPSPNRLKKIKNGYAPGEKKSHRTAK
jgi:hypothetical protein